MVPKLKKWARPNLRVGISIRNQHWFAVLIPSRFTFLSLSISGREKGLWKCVNYIELNRIIIRYNFLVPIIDSTQRIGRAQQSSVSNLNLRSIYIIISNKSPREWCSKLDSFWNSPVSFQLLCNVLSFNNNYNYKFRPVIWAKIYIWKIVEWTNLINFKI